MREVIETAHALKQIVTAGVRVFFDLEELTPAVISRDVEDLREEQHQVERRIRNITDAVADTRGELSSVVTVLHIRVSRSGTWRTIYVRAVRQRTRTSQPPRQQPGGAHPDERRQLSPAALEHQGREHHRAGDRDGNASPELEEAAATSRCRRRTGRARHVTRYVRMRVDVAITSAPVNVLKTVARYARLHVTRMEPIGVRVLGCTRAKNAGSCPCSPSAYIIRVPSSSVVNMVPRSSISATSANVRPTIGPRTTVAASASGRAEVASPGAVPIATS